MKEIKVQNSNRTFIVEDEDYESAIRYKWYCGDVRPIIHNGEGISIGRFLLKVTESHLRVDHIDRNIHNNLRSNLRVCNNAQNAMNRPKTKRNTSGYKGVYWKKTLGRWRAQIRVNGVDRHLGDFRSKEDAARAYNEGAKQYFGEFAYFNEIT